MDEINSNAMRPTAKHGALEMALCAVLWSISGVFIKQIPWNPMVIAGFRALLAAGVLFIYMKVKKFPFIVSYRVFVIGSFLCMNNFLIMAANKLTTAANAIVLQYTAPVFLLIYEAFINRQPIRKGDVIAVTVTLSGIILFFFDQLAPGAMLGNILAVLAGVAFAGMMASTGGVTNHTRMSGLVAGQLATAVIGIPFIFFFGAPLTFPAVGSILVLGIFQVGIPYILYNLATQTCSPIACSLLAALEPILNPVWVFLFVGEIPGKTALWGGVLVVLSISCWSIWDYRLQKKRSCQEMFA
ncbi:MAG: EamA family transporter, partial [Clostridiales bacterium]|nr:EamA family transporter [Clostridiales bacterium]